MVSVQHIRMTKKSNHAEDFRHVGFARLLVLLLCCLLSKAALAQNIVQLPLVPDDVADGFVAIGRVNAASYRTREMCTGTLIAPDAVLSAAHCVLAPDGARQKLQDGVFVAGYRRGEALAVGEIAFAQIHPRYLANAQAALAHDIAILRLKEPIETILPFAPALSVQASHLGLIGYHRHRPHLLSGQFDCPVLASNARQILLDCPVHQGNSGGPVLISEGGEWRVVGVVSAKVNGFQALAVRVDDWVLEALSDRCLDATKPGGC